MNASYHIFDRKRVRLHRDRAAARFTDSDFLIREMAARVSDRLPDILRRFPVALDLGAHNGILAEYLIGLGGIETLVQSDMSQTMIAAATGLKLVADEEFLPFAAGSFDLVMSVASLHWVNDIPGTLAQIQRILKPGGMFLAMLPGGETLKELRQAFEQAELAVTGGLSPRVSPFIDVRDAGSLLQRAGFIMPVTDSELLTVRYAHPLKLLQDLRAMGETSALMTSVKSCTPQTIIAAAMEHYQKHFIDNEGRYRATFELVTMTGWKADATPP